MVMGDDSCAKGRGFESRRRIRDGHFCTFICCKNCNVCLKKTENKRKRGRGWPNLKKNCTLGITSTLPSCETRIGEGCLTWLMILTME